MEHSNSNISFSEFFFCIRR